MPLAGGLTDVRRYAEEHGGVTVSATIGAAAWVTWLPAVNGRFEVVADGVSAEAATLSEVHNPLVRAALAAVDPRHPPVRLGVWLDVAGRSGLGASGAICAALVQAATTARGETLAPAALGALAARVEVEDLDGASGYHDANIAARGGLRCLEYRGSAVTDVPLALTPARRDAALGSLLLFASARRGETRPSLSKLARRFDAALPVLHAMKEVAWELVGALRAGDLARFAWCVGEQQRLKQLLPGDFDDDWVRSLVARVTRLGATLQVPGGKIGGFVLVCCPDGQAEAVRRALPELREVPLSFTETGCSATRL